MSKVSRLLLAVFIAGSYPTIATAHEPKTQVPNAEELTPLTRQAAQTVDAFHAALARGDTVAALALLSSDALIFEEGSAERSKAEYAAQHLGADAEFTAAVPSTRTRRTGNAIGANAWIATEGRVTGNFKGRAVDRISAETMVLRRAGAVWQIVHIHWSSRSPPA
jgi:ketosteroid isomerase-like protein